MQEVRSADVDGGVAPGLALAEPHVQSLFPACFLGLAVDRGLVVVAVRGTDRVVEDEAAAGRLLVGEDAVFQRGRHFDPEFLVVGQVPARIGVEPDRPVIEEGIHDPGVQAPAGSRVGERSVREVDREVVVLDVSPEPDPPVGSHPRGGKPAFQTGAPLGGLAVNPHLSVDAEDPQVPGIVHLVPGDHPARHRRLLPVDRIEDDEAPVSGLVRERGEPEAHGVDDPVQRFPVGVGGRRTVGVLAVIALVLPDPQEMKDVLPPVGARPLAGHDQVDVRVLLVVDPVHPGDLGPVVAGVAAGPGAVEEHVGPPVPVLRGGGGRHPAGHGGQEHGQPEHPAGPAQAPPWAAPPVGFGHTLPREVAGAITHGSWSTLGNQRPTTTHRTRRPSTRGSRTLFQPLPAVNRGT